MSGERVELLVCRYHGPQEQQPLERDLTQRCPGSVIGGDCDEVLEHRDFIPADTLSEIADELDARAKFSSTIPEIHAYREAAALLRDRQGTGGLSERVPRATAQVDPTESGGVPGWDSPLAESDPPTPERCTCFDGVDADEMVTRDPQCPVHGGSVSEGEE